MTKKELEKQLVEAKLEYKKQFEYITTGKDPLDECESYLEPYFNVISLIKNELQNYEKKIN